MPWSSWNRAASAASASAASVAGAQASGLFGNARVQARSVRNGQIFHSTGLMRLGRDALMRVMGARLMDVPWLYGR